MDIWSACKSGDCKYVREYFNDDGNVDAQNNCGETALILASVSGHKEIAELLLNHNANVEIRDKYGYTALMKASWNGHKDIVKLLLDNGANVEAQDNDGWTAIMYASRDRHINVVRFLIDCGANMDIQENNGWTSIMMALHNGHENIVRLLVDANAKLDTRNEDGDTVLSLALGQSRFNMALPLALKMIPDHGIPYSGAPISTFVPQNESASQKEYIKMVSTIVPLYLNRAVEDPQFAFDMQCDIEEILRGKATEYQWTLNEKEKSILTKLLKTLRSIDYTDRTVENICIQDADKQKNEASFSYTYDMEL